MGCVREPAPTRTQKKQTRKNHKEAGNDFAPQAEFRRQDRNRINAGFGAVLALLVLVAALGYFALSSLGTTFADYARISASALRISESDRSVVGLRRNLAAYIGGNEQALQRMRDLAKPVRENLDQLVANATVAERREMAQRILGQLDKFMANVDTIAKDKPERDRLIYQVMAPIGEKLATKLSDTMVGTSSDNQMGHRRLCRPRAGTASFDPHECLSLSAVPGRQDRRDRRAAVRGAERRAEETRQGGGKHRLRSAVPDGRQRGRGIYRRVPQHREGRQGNQQTQRRARRRDGQ